MDQVISIITGIKNSIISLQTEVVKTVSSVLSSLGVNDTVWVQFGITLVFLLIVRYVFINDLTRVLTEREINTQGAETDAEKLNQETQIIKKRYEKILNENIVQLNNEYSAERKKVKDAIDGDYKAKEDQIIKAYKDSIGKKISEFKNLENEIKKGTQTLADELLKKIKQ